MTLRFKTTARYIRFGCCGLFVALVQRGYDTERIVWTGVPCKCGKTYSFESEPVAAGESRADHEELSDDMHPELERMHCWAIPNHQPASFLDMPPVRVTPETAKGR